MKLLDKKEIRDLKIGDTITLDAEPPISKAGEFILDKIVLWQEGGAFTFRGNSHVFSLRDLIRLHATGEPIVKTDRRYM